MAIAALPDYLGNDFSTASPGLRFGMYLKIWTTNFAKETDKAEPLRKAGKLNDNDQKILKGVYDRQQAIFQTLSLGNSTLKLDAISTAPFATGLGNEHPTENGFAFLNPYGLPYLPGSGVKGVLRQAARELASGEWDDKNDWSDEEKYPLCVNGKAVLGNNKEPIMLSIIDVLFGRETADGDKEQLRGALTFWDVIPQIKGDGLQVEVMTPHQKHYYQEGQTPHDSGQPIPINFLTVPAGSGFTFHVQCNVAFLNNTAPELTQDNHWQKFLQSAFEHAFNWLGFGAKTAAGYGVMADKQKMAQAEEQLRQEELKKAGIVVGASIWEAAEVIAINPGSGEIQVKNSDGKLATGKFSSQLSDAAKKRWKNKKKVYLNVEIEEKGNLITIVAIREISQ